MSVFYFFGCYVCLILIVMSCSGSFVSVFVSWGGMIVCLLILFLMFVLFVILSGCCGGIYLILIWMMSLSMFCCIGGFLMSVLILMSDLFFVCGL